jgi:hypothetical protein
MKNSYIKIKVEDNSRLPLEFMCEEKKEQKTNKQAYKKERKDWICANKGL